MVHGIGPSRKRQGMSIAEEVSPETLAQQAQHESGHAAASWAQGISFKRMLLSGPRGMPCVEPVPGNRVMVGQNWLIQCCGGIADQQRRGLRMRGSQIVKLILGGGDDEFVEVDDAETGEVVLRRLSRVPPVVNRKGTCTTWQRFCRAASLTPPVSAFASGVTRKGSQKSYGLRSMRWLLPSWPAPSSAMTRLRRLLRRQW